MRFGLCITEYSGMYYFVHLSLSLLSFVSLFFSSCTYASTTYRLIEIVESVFNLSCLKIKKDNRPQLDIVLIFMTISSQLWTSNKVPFTLPPKNFELFGELRYNFSTGFTKMTTFYLYYYTDNLVDPWDNCIVWKRIKLFYARHIMSNASLY